MRPVITGNWHLRFLQDAAGRTKRTASGSAGQRTFAVVQPFVSPTPFCTHLYPMRHMANFGEASTNELKDLARVLPDVLARLYFGFENPDFSPVLRSAPTANAGAKYYH